MSVAQKLKRQTAIRIGLPTMHSRLHPKVMGLLGLECLSDPRQLVFRSPHADIFLLRGWDIASMVERGRLDLGFAGYDTIEELGTKVNIRQEFKHISSPVGVCKPRDRELSPMGRMVIATEYPNLARRFLAARSARLDIVAVHGATEVFPHLEGIDAILDIVETGDTLRANNLELVEVLLHTYPCIVTNENFGRDPEELLLENLRESVVKALNLPGG